MSLNRQNIIDAYKIWLNREASNEEIDLKLNHAVANNWGWTELSHDMRTGSDEFKNMAESKVNWWFKEADYGPERDPTPAELDHYVNRIAQVGWKRLDTIEGDPPGSGDIGKIYYTDKGYANKEEYEAAQSGTQPPNPTLPVEPEVPPEEVPPAPTPTGDTGANDDSKFIIPGKGGDKFGDADYNELLKRTDGSIGQLKKVRADVLAWILEHPNRDSILAKQNKPNYEGGSNEGLYERINTATPEFDWDKGGRFFTHWGDEDVDINRTEGVSSSDIRAWKAGGHSTFQIYSHMNRNKNLWKDSTEATEEYNIMRQELITRGNDWGNMYGHEDGKYSWRHTFENPLFQDIGTYLKSAGVESDKDVSWWMYDKDAYDETIDWLNERHQHHDWLTADKRGNVTTGPRTQEQLEDLIGKAGLVGTGGVGVGGDYTEGEYWQKWGEEGPRTDGELNLAETQKVAGGLGLGHLNIGDEDIEDKLEAIEQRFLKEMYVSVDSTSMDPKAPDDPAKYHQAQDSWGLDIVRKNMRPEDWDEDWFDGDEMDNSWFQTLAYGDEESVDWAFYNDNKFYKDAQKALGMDDKIDTIKEIREANTYVYAAVLAEEHSDHLDDWIPYEPQFDNTTPIPKPIEIDVGDYKTPDKEELTPAPDQPAAPTINIPRVNVKRPENMPDNLKIAGGEY